MGTMIRMAPPDRGRLIKDTFEECGSNKAEFARQVKVSEKSTKKWLDILDDENALAAINQSSLQQLVDAAARLGLQPAFYQEVPRLWDWRKSYRENIAMPMVPPPRLGREPSNHRIEFLGMMLASPFGISASVLTSTAMRAQYFAHTCCDIVVLKTVRPVPFDGYPPTNVLFCSPPLSVLSPDQPLPNPVELIQAEAANWSSLGLVNHFGVPSLHPEQWRLVLRDTMSTLRDPERQLVIQSVVGGPADTNLNLIKGFADAAGFAAAEGARVIEVNGSCPNAEGEEGRVYHNPELAAQVMAAVKDAAPKAKLVFKTGYLPKSELRALVRAIAGNIDAIAAINTLPVHGVVREQNGSQYRAFGGVEAGLSGEPIRLFGLRCVKNLDEIKSEDGLEHIAVIGIGGITSVEHVREYIAAGAKLVLATSIFLDDPLFGIRVRAYLDSAAEFDKLAADDQQRAAYFNWDIATNNLRENGVVLSEETAWGVWRRWHADHRDAARSGVRRSGVGFSVDDFETKLKRTLGIR